MILYNNVNNFKMAAKASKKQLKLDFEKKLPVRLPYYGLVPAMRRKINTLFSRYLDDRQPSLFDKPDEFDNEDEVEIPESKVDDIIQATKKELESIGLKAVKGSDSITFNMLSKDEQDKYWQ